MSDNHKRRSGEDVTNPDGYLATQDLRERGWTVKLIAQFLGDHDLTRPNGLRMGRRRLPPVKLYLESRVEQAENNEDFLVLSQQAQDRRERARERRAEKLRERAEQLEHLASGYQPKVKAQGIRKGARNKAKAPYLPQLEATLQGIAEQMELSSAEQKELRRLLTLRLESALSRVYPWFPDPQATQEAPKATATQASKEAQPADWQQWEWD